VAQVTQQFGHMGVGDPNQPQQPMQPQQVPRAVPLNQLYPTDLLTQPFNVAEIDYPPPPIILPPNVGFVVVNTDNIHC
jgi:protein transport protein SEC24